MIEIRVKFELAFSPSEHSDECISTDEFSDLRPQELSVLDSDAALIGSITEEERPTPRLSREHLQDILDSEIVDRSCNPIEFSFVLGGS